MEMDARCGLQLSGQRIGIAMTGSFCTFHKVFEQIEALSRQGAQLLPILSENAYSLDTRFYRSGEVRARLAAICGREIWHTLMDVEPIGPQKLTDLIVVAPCTGNTLGKLANGIIDTSVTMAVKSQLRNGRPVLLAISTNDGLSGCAKNIGALLGVRNVYFVPFGQDDPENKPSSLVARMELIPDAAEAALAGRQLQPMLRQRMPV